MKRKIKNRVKKRFIFIIFTAFILVLLISYLCYFKLSGEAVKNSNERGFVTKVIDGDTIIVEGKKVRLLGIDADEKGYACYEEAKKRLEELVLNKAIRLEKDRIDKDQYGRLLRYVWLNNTNINLLLVKEGLAIARIENAFKYADQFVSAEQEARTKAIGCKWSPVDAKETYKNYRWNRLNEKLGLKIVNACEAIEHLNEEAIVEGKIAEVYVSKNNNAFLNFEKPYPNQCFTAVIFSHYLDKFKNLKDYEGNVVRVKGKIKEYKGKAEIILKDPNQIEIGVLVI